MENINDTEPILSFGEREFSFIEVPDKVDCTESYLVKENSKTYKLFFTRLPITSINTDNEIIDEPKVKGSFLYKSETEKISANIGIEIRGSFSQGFPKKTYDIEVREKNTNTNIKGSTENQIKIGNLRLDDDWVLDALYNEPLRIRSYVSHKLWLDFHKLYYSKKEPYAKAGADVEYTELFINGKYKGIYYFSEQIDRKLLKLKKYNNKLKGELYKTVNYTDLVSFIKISSFNNNYYYWDGIEYKYPKPDVFMDWNNIHNFYSMVINHNYSLEHRLPKQINIKNLVDYYIFINILRAYDNHTKNVYIAKYNTNEPYFFVPWDLDTSFGINHKGDNYPSTEEIITNILFDKCIKYNVSDFNQLVKERWQNTKTNIFDKENLKKRFNNAYNILTSNNVYEREKLVFPNYKFDNESLQYIYNWIDGRLDFIDSHFNTLNVRENEDPNKEYTFYPNPAKNFIIVHNECKDQQSKVEILDITGKVLLKDYIASSKMISTENLQSGIYFIKINKETSKLIINK
ncbi:MAG: CotH kinase family protein [Hyphomicrobiales bacterium]